MASRVQIMDKVLWRVTEDYSEIKELLSHADMVGEFFIELHDVDTLEPLSVNLWQMSYYRPEPRGD